MPGFGALAKLLGATSKETIPAAERIGEFFRSIPASEYFGVAKTPAKSVGEAERLYNLKLDNASDFVRAGPAELNFLQRHRADVSPLGDFLTRYVEDLPDSDILHLSRLDQGMPVSHISAARTAFGEGSAPRTYGAMLDVLAARPDSPMNVTSALTPVNVFRKPLNIADVLKRNEALEGKILPNYQMTKPLGVESSEFLELSPDAQLGGLYLSGGLGALRRIQQQAGMEPAKRLLLPGDEAHAFIQGIDPTTDFEKFRDLYGADWAKGGIGANTLRKMSIMDAVLSGETGRLPAVALRRLGYAGGGLVDTDLERMSHEHLYQLRGQSSDPAYQRAIAPYEHRAFAREFAQEHPWIATPSLLAAIPAYSAAKALGLIRSRTPASLDEMVEAYRGLGEGLTNALGYE